MMNPAISSGPKWFHIAVQALVVLAATTDGACPSNAMAQELKAHAVFVRRVLSHLVRAGLVEAYEGRDGGYLLARSPEHITLADVYLAVKPACNDEVESSLNASISTIMAGIEAQAEQQMLEVFAKYSVASVQRRMVAAD